MTKDTECDLKCKNISTLCLWPCFDCILLSQKLIFARPSGEHNGVCRNGAKDVGFLKKFNMDMPKSNESFEHCTYDGLLIEWKPTLIYAQPPFLLTEGVCPKGYVGVQCEHMVDVCPGGEHVCMNGAEVCQLWMAEWKERNCNSLCPFSFSRGLNNLLLNLSAQCVPDDSDGRLKYKCDCDTVHMPFHKYAGDFCELKSTELCTFNGRPGTGLNKDAYCVNGGKCQGHANEHNEWVYMICWHLFESDASLILYSMPCSASIGILAACVPQVLKAVIVNTCQANEAQVLPSKLSLMIPRKAVTERTVMEDYQRLESFSLLSSSIWWFLVQLEHTSTGGDSSNATSAMMVRHAPPIWWLVTL